MAAPALGLRAIIGSMAVSRSSDAAAYHWPLERGADLMTEAALIIASPWPRTGTANLFAAQSLFLSSRGYRTAVLLSPHQSEHRVKFRDWWTSTLDAMRYEGIHLLCRATTSHRTKPWRSLSYLQWLLAGRDSQLAIMARYAAAAELPRS